ncbi:MAG: CxxC-x17-CxxC domain-containing protein [Candidatus Omnitrophota bacterium]
MKHGKAKASQKSSGVVKNGLPELVAMMTKISERLEVLEKKTDLVISQTSVRSSEGREYPKPVPQPSVPSQPFRQPDPSQQRSNEVKPVPVQTQAQNHQRPGRVLHKAVCADCHRDCEIPFKPTGERPVYCKECFSKRKGGNSFKGSHGNNPAPNLPQTTAPVNLPQRQVVVTKKGVGKVTVSEIVRSPARDNSHKNKGHKPAKKSKR